MRVCVYVQDTDKIKNYTNVWLPLGLVISQDPLSRKIIYKDVFFILNTIQLMHWVSTVVSQHCGPEQVRWPEVAQQKIVGGIYYQQIKRVQALMRSVALMIHIIVSDLKQQTFSWNTPIEKCMHL